MTKIFALALHGGAGASRKLAYDVPLAHMRATAEMARDRLAGGDSALDVAVAVVAELERSGLYIAGRGGSPNANGVFELDASVMDGATGRAGAVAALRGFQQPVEVARRVMEATPHVLLAGAGAAAFAREQGMLAIESDGWFTPAGIGESNHAPGVLPMSTVGCAVLDVEGRLAAATSSGGVFEKLPGRVGDSPIPGAGVWADARAAASCTGQGELFIRTAAAARVGFLVEAGRSLDEAVAETLDLIAAQQGEGGIVAVSAKGEVTADFRTEGMKRAWVKPDGSIGAAVF